MCNLYNMTDKGTAERYLGSMGATLDVEDFAQATVGPFQSGLMVRPGLPGESAQLVGRMGQWGMIRAGSTTRRPASRVVLTNNARIEGIAERVTYRGPWAQGQRCLILADWYQEPNWETGKNIWWRLRRADGAPWALAGLWSHWLDPATGELVPNFTMITCNCDAHPLLARLHKPDPKLPPDQQDKRAVTHIDPVDWSAWLHGTPADARALVRPQPGEVFDLADARATDALLASREGGASAQGSLL